MKVIFYQVKIISDMTAGCHKSKQIERGMYMYARQALYKLKEMDKEWFFSSSREVMTLFNESEGCSSSYIIFDEEQLDCGSFSIWETREAMETAIPRIADKFRQLARERLESVNIRIYEIYKK
jgi:hypothetical protein